MKRDEILGALGRAYTHSGHTHKPVDVELCVVMAEELEAAQSKATATNSDYAKCADEILLLDSADAVINKQGCIVSILRRHFA